MIAGISTTFSGFIDRLNPRERVLLGVMVVIAVGMVCFLIVIMTSRSMATLEEEVGEQGMLLKQLRGSAAKLREKLGTPAATSKIPETEPPALGTQLQAHATKAGMAETDLEMTPQPEEQIGSWIRKSVQVRLRRQPLGELANFWALTVNDRAQYPVAITKLNIRRRRHEEDAYDVEMIVSSYWPSEEPPPTNGNSKRRGGRSTSKAGRSKSRP